MQVTCARIGTRVYLRRFDNIPALTARNTSWVLLISSAKAAKVLQQWDSEPSDKLTRENNDEPQERTETPEHHYQGRSGT
jgi:hypothetical protein